VYTKFSNQAVVNASPQKVQVSDFADVAASDTFGGDVTAQLNAKYNGAAVAKLTTVTFPAGAENIVYDPSTGSGDPVQPPPTAAASLVVAGWLSIAAVVFSFLL